MPAMIRALRPAQWSKNLLLAVPMLVGHRLGDGRKWTELALAFAAFSLAASAVYIINDLADLAADRRHPTKRGRPFASGELSRGTGLAMAGVLIAVAAGISAAGLPGAFGWALGAYLLLTSAYSMGLKRAAILDVILLAGLYAHRLIAGGLATDVFPSPWLLAFSSFLFLSLALAKRVAELLALKDAGDTQAAGRGYAVGDIELLKAAGVSSGYLSVLVFCLYISSDAVTLLYRSPLILWLICPLLVYWITRVWFLAQRRVLLEDPVLFTLTDKVSYAVLAGTLALLALAKTL